MKKQKMIRWLAWAVAGIACVAGGIHVNQKYQEREAAIRAIEARAQAKSQEEEDLANGILTWNGKKYRRNTAIRAILCIGVDTKGEMEAQNVAGKGGDADALFLVAQDAAKDEAQIVLIPRNTMTEIEVFDYFGNPIGTETKQLTLAYAFGDGREKSCELTVGALSKLLFGLQIDGYFAVNMDSIPYFNDAVGGVPITVEDEMIAEKYPDDFKMGETVTLTGDLTEKYVRFRDINEDGSATVRLPRQKGYLKSFIQRAKESQTADKTTITRLVDGIQEKAITNMAKDQYMDMGLAMLNSPKTMEDGDFIEAGNVSGTVRDIGLIYTQLCTIDNKDIYVPNSDLSASKIVNYNREPQRRVDLTFGADYTCRPEQVKAALHNAVSLVSGILPEPAPFVRVSGYGESNIEYTVRVWCKTADYWTVYYDLMEAVGAAFDAHGVSMSYPQMNVHVLDTPESAKKD